MPANLLPSRNGWPQPVRALDPHDDLRMQIITRPRELLADSGPDPGQRDCGDGARTPDAMSTC